MCRLAVAISQKFGRYVDLLGGGVCGILRFAKRVKGTAMNSSHGEKVLVIGLDGASFNVLRPMIGKGILPNLAELIQGGVSGELESTLPPTTAPAWGSFMTGKNPGKHGLFDWRKPFDKSLQRVTINATHIRSKKLWNIIGACGKKVGVVNVPLTYPPEEVKGYLVSGMLTPSLDSDFTYPSDLKQQLREAVGEYVIDVDVTLIRAKRDIEGFLREFQKATLKREEVVNYLFSKQRFDFFMVVFIMPDRIQHLLWDYVSDRPLTIGIDRAEFQKRHDKVWECYRMLDEVIGRLLEKVDRDTTVFILSDHGFGRVDKLIHVNEWLAAEGFLEYKSSKKRRDLMRSLLLPARELLPEATRLKVNAVLTSLPSIRSVRQLLQKCPQNRFLQEGPDIVGSIDWEKTKAYSGFQSGNAIFINVRGREPYGVVQMGQEYEDLKRLLKENLTQLTDHEGIRVMKKVYLREEIYDGSHVNEAPDIIFELNDGYMATPSSSGREIISDASESGLSWHTKNGILIANGMNMKQGEEIHGASIIDLAPTILYAMGLPIPADMDGRVLSDLFVPSFLEENPLHYVRDDSEEDLFRDDQSVFSEEDERKVEERLRGLGYI
jgi:predicted AlkP superfamily phosphohydrolase/phosphomutase